jgi:hypothetical protein
VGSRFRLLLPPRVTLPRIPVGGLGGSAGEFPRHSNRDSRHKAGNDSLRVLGFNFKHPPSLFELRRDKSAARTLSFGPAGSPSGMHPPSPWGCGGERPPCVEGRGRGMAPAWTGFAGVSQHHRWQEKRGIPRPRAALSRQHAHREMFPPLAQDLAGGVRAFTAVHAAGPRKIAPLGAALPGPACTGAELVPPSRETNSTLATPAPALLNSHAQPPSSPERWGKYPRGSEVLDKFHICTARIPASALSAR